jgi:hypothetical protein
LKETKTSHSNGLSRSSSDSVAAHIPTHLGLRDLPDEDVHVPHPHVSNRARS